MSDSLREDKKDSRKASWLLGVGLAVAVLVLVAVVFFLLKTSKVVEPVALKIDTREVSKAQFDKYVAQGKQHQLGEASVKQIVIEYEKNQVAAKKLDVSVPAELIDLSREDTTINARAGGSANRDDELTAMRRYNIVFDQFVLNAARGGTNIVVYDIPISPLVPEGSPSRASVQQQAKSIRERLAQKQISAQAALSETRQANIGQPAQSGVYFVDIVNGQQLNQSGGDSGRLLDPSFLKTYLADKQSGITQVEPFENKGYFFMDILYKRDARQGLTDNVRTTKEGLRVVDYVG